MVPSGIRSGGCRRAKPRVSRENEFSGGGATAAGCSGIVWQAETGVATCDITCDMFICHGVCGRGRPVRPENHLGSHPCIMSV